MLLVAVDNTILALAIPRSLAEDLSPTPTELLWIGDIYSFVPAGLLVTMGNVGDRVGRKKLLMIGLVGFAVVSVIAAFSPTAEALIASRALLGVAGATLMPPRPCHHSQHIPRRTRTHLCHLGVECCRGGWRWTGTTHRRCPARALLVGSVFLVNVPIVPSLSVSVHGAAGQQEPEPRPD